MTFQQIWPMIYVDPIIVWLETNWDLILEIESMLGCQLGTHQQCWNKKEHWRSKFLKNSIILNFQTVVNPHVVWFFAVKNCLKREWPKFSIENNPNQLTNRNLEPPIRPEVLPTVP